MSYRNPALYTAMRSYVSTAINLVATRADNESHESEPDEEMFFFARLTANDELEKLPEYQKCVEMLNADATFTRQMDVLAGTRSGIRSRTQNAQGLMWRLLDLGRPPGRCNFSAEHFEQEYAALEEAYYNPEIAYEAIAPVQGLLIDNSVHLSDDLEISQLTEDELTRPNVRKRTPVSDDPWREKVCAVRVKYSLPKVVGDDQIITPEEEEKDHAKRAEVNDRIDQVITALRLSKMENVCVAWTVHKTSQWTFGQDRSYPGRFQPEILYSNQVEDEWLESFTEFWKILQNQEVKNRKFLDIAVRRFGYAHERHRIEDKIVDLLIAAEALFLCDGSYIGELRYRLSLRAALFLAIKGEAQKSVFRWMRAAYDLRSTVAHGGEPKPDELPKYPDGSAATLEQFVWQIQEYVRLAIIKAIHLAVQPNTPYALVNWDELVFGDDK
jgi:hypothetical protein